MFIDTIMGLASKEENVLELIFNSPKHWHFEELIKESKLSRGRLNHWLKKLLNEKIIKRIKEKDKMPYYVGNFDSPSYKNQKRMYALNKLYKTGFLNHLQSLSDAKTVIIFGSFSRSDWYENSDIDLFIYGSAQGLNLSKYELDLEREIQLFECKDKNNLKKFGEGLIKNIIKGNIIKGNLDFCEVKV